MPEPSVPLEESTLNILALDTAGPWLSLALQAGSRKFYLNFKDGFRHAEKLTETIALSCRELGLSPSDLDLLICAEGPGSFTGLRIGLSTVKGLSLGLGIPFVCVSAPEAYADHLRFFEGTVVPLIPARKNRYYSGLFRQGSPQTGVLDISLPELRETLKSHDPVLLTGIGAPLLCREESRFLLDPEYDHGRAPAFLRLGYRRYLKNGGDASGRGPEYGRAADVG